MAFDGFVLRAVRNELAEELIGGKIEKIYQPSRDEIIINVRHKGDSRKLLISCNSSFPKIHLLHGKRENPDSPPAFCMLLRKKLTNSSIIAVEQIKYDRILRIELEGRDELLDKATYNLYVEIMGRHSNIVLVDSEGIIIDSAIRVNSFISSYREILPGKTYVLPPEQNKACIDDTKLITSEIDLSIPLDKSFLNAISGISPMIAKEMAYNVLSVGLNLEIVENELVRVKEIVTKSKFKPCIYYLEKVPKYFSAFPQSQFEALDRYESDSISQVIEMFYEEKSNAVRVSQWAFDLEKTLKQRIERSKNKIFKIESELIEADKRQLFKKYGDLLNSNLHLIKPASESVTLYDYEEGENINIPLDVRLSPSKNAQKYYKIYAKLKTASSLLKEQLENAISDIRYFEETLFAIDNSESRDDIEEIRNELVKLGVVKKSKLKTKSLKAKPLHYISSDGIDIYIGKNNTQNDEVTFIIGKPKDLWLHAKDIPGSHVIVRFDDTIPDSTLLEAANLAVKYSKAKMSTKVPIDYTFRKNVKKPTGSKPGLVIYSNHKTLIIDYSDDIYNRITRAK